MSADTEQNFALDRETLERRCQILDLERQGALWLYENLKKKVLEQSGGSVGRTVGAAPEGGPASSSHPVPTPPGPTPHRQQRQRPSISRTPYPTQQNDRRARRTLAPPVLESPGTVRHNNPEDRRVFASVLGALCADNSPRNRAAVFGAAGFFDFQLTTAQVTCVRNTPDTSWRIFTHVFGGNLHVERPVGTRVLGYEKFLCTSAVTQPFAPTHPGEPGGILSYPDAPSLDIFHVLVDPSPGGKKTALQYCGIYKTVQSMEVQVDEWHAVPKMCRRKFLERLRRMAVGEVHAWCSLRMRRGYTSDPSPAETQEFLQGYRQGSEILEYKAIISAFERGAEQFNFEVIKCVGYDIHLAELIQRRINR